eukprot:3555329-Pleurochrysis_carterae.AAC.3
MAVNAIDAVFPPASIKRLSLLTTRPPQWMYDGRLADGARRAALVQDRGMGARGRSQSPCYSRRLWHRSLVAHRPIYYRSTVFERFVSLKRPEPA